MPVACESFKGSKISFFLDLAPHSQETLIIVLIVGTTKQSFNLLLQCDSPKSLCSLCSASLKKLLQHTITSSRSCIACA